MSRWTQRSEIDPHHGIKLGGLELKDQATGGRMLKMDQVHVMRYKVLVEDQPIRRVAREMSISRNTVRKYLKLSQPTRNEQRARARPVLEKVASPDR